MKALIDARFCSGCGETKAPTEFHKKAHYCKVCANARSKVWHSVRENLDKRNAKTKERHKDKKQWAIDYMGGKCADCGQSFPNCCYDFHHLDMSNKSENPSYFIRLKRERAIEELMKCVMLCANCHRVRHFQ